METTIVYWSYIGIMAKEMEATIVEQCKPQALLLIVVPLHYMFVSTSISPVFI